MYIFKLQYCDGIIILLRNMRRITLSMDIRRGSKWLLTWCISNSIHIKHFGIVKLWKLIYTYFLRELTICWIQLTNHVFLVYMIECFDIPNYEGRTSTNWRERKDRKNFESPNTTVSCFEFWAQIGLICISLYTEKRKMGSWDPALP